MCRKLNVLYYEPSTGYGGSARCLSGWLKHMNKNKIKPIVSVHFNGPVIRGIRESGVPVVNIFYFNFLKQLSMKIKGREFLAYIVFAAEFILNIVPVALRLVLIIKRKKIDLVDVNSSIITGIPGILAAKFAGVPCVCHLHDTRSLTSKEKFLVKDVRKFFILTKEALHLYDSLGQERMILLYNGLELQTWKISGNAQHIRQELKIPTKNIVVGMAGRITNGKGQPEFLRAAEIVGKSRNDVTFLIVGGTVFTDKDYEAEMHRLASKFRVNDRIIFTGWRDDIRELMSMFDIFVFPTTTFPEGFGMVCIEAMALNKPVVASDIPGPSEIVADELTGFLVTPGDERALAEKILYLIANPLILKKMGAAGRKRVEILFDVKKTVEIIENVYEEILAANVG